MKNQLDKAIRRVMAARHAEHRRAAVLVILALLTILSVSWRLHQVGIAMTDDEYSCGYEEHVHSDACYTEVLICGYEDGASETPADSAEEDGKTAPAAHSHTADCYQRVLTCTLPEHTHTLECLADITADVETPADWDEQSEGVSSFWSDAMTEIAQRQLGYTESAKNFTVDKALGETLAQAHHYTRYGDWYGNPYGSWDVMFVAFCQHYAGIPEDVIPQCASLLQLRTELENAHPEYITPGGSEATPGDIVLYTNAAGEETIGIVTAYDGANLTVVSGAVDGAVAAVTVAEADVTNTIRVLDAYGVYAQTGASDGSEELSFDADAILARDGAVAYIVWQWPDPIMPAAEDDDTLTAAAATPQYDSEGNLKLDNLLTSTAISIKQGNVWEPLDNDASIKDGTPVRVEIAYKVPAGALQNDKNTATYTLPKGVYPKKDLTGNITDSNDEIIGTFTLTKNSPTVTFTFNNNTNHEFHGTFKFETPINYAETGGDGQIHLGEKTYTIEPEYSLNTKKEHTLSEDNSKVSYTVTVNAPNGTHNQTVTITDRLAAENTASGSYDTSSIKIDGKPLSEYTDPDNGISVSDDATAVHRIRLQFSRTDGKKLRILRCTISDIPTVAKTSDMANNTKRHFENRVEIYSDNAGREGWKGTYDYTKIGSITKETSDKSGDGYKQNNSTTYAKNKVIWYCIKLNLGSGDVDKTHTLTVVDKIPDGMKLATDNNSLSSYRIAADLDAKPGNKYTGNIKSPSENIYSLVLNGVTYWSIDTSVSGQLTIQVLPNTLKNLIVPSKTTDHYVEIRYALRLDDATAWNERTLEEKTYTNRITQSTALS